MRAARLWPSWNIGRFVLAAEDGLSKRRLWPVPGGWLSLRCSSGGRTARICSGLQEVLANAPVVIAQRPGEPVLDPWLGYNRSAGVYD
jgi:hypothetical protein